jgi:hypothetical protein
MAHRLRLRYVQSAWGRWFIQWRACGLLIEPRRIGHLHLRNMLGAAANEPSTRY